MTKHNKDGPARAVDMSEPKVTGKLVMLWNRGGPIDRNTNRCGNLVLSVSVVGEENDLGRVQVGNKMHQCRPGLSEVDSGYWDRCVADVAAQRAYAKRTSSPLGGIAQWLEDGELIANVDLDSMNKRDATEAIEGSSDLTLVLKIANAGGAHAQIARDHLERVTDGGAALLGHFGSHDPS